MALLILNHIRVLNAPTCVHALFHLIVVSIVCPQNSGVPLDHWTNLYFFFLSIFIFYGNFETCKSIENSIMNSPYTQYPASTISNYSSIHSLTIFLWIILKQIHYIISFCPKIVYIFKLQEF